MSNRRMIEVIKAEPYNMMEMGSFGKAENMLFCQFNFPAKYNPCKDLMVVAYSDRMWTWDHDHMDRLLKDYDINQMGFGNGISGMGHKKALEFCVKALKADECHPGTKWTGYRVTGCVNRSNGYPIFIIAVFCNKSGTPVYTGLDPHNCDIPAKNCGTMSMYGPY